MKKQRNHVRRLNFWFVDYPGMIGKGNASLRDLPLGGT
jgi:hypothetical protein